MVMVMAMLMVKGLFYVETADVVCLLLSPLGLFADTIALVRTDQ